MKVRQLERLKGWRTAPPLETSYWTEYNSVGSRLAYSRWLSKQNLPDVKRLIEVSRPVTYKVTTNPNDMIRANNPDRKVYYESCLTDLQMQVYAAEPRMAMLYVPDLAGTFRNRVWLVVDPNGDLTVARPYGEQMPIIMAIAHLFHTIGKPVIGYYSLKYWKDYLTEGWPNAKARLGYDWIDFKWKTRLPWAVNTEGNRVFHGAERLYTANHLADQLALGNL